MTSHVFFLIAHNLLINVSRNIKPITLFLELNILSNEKILVQYLGAIRIISNTYFILLRYLQYLLVIICKKLSKIIYHSYN